MRNFYVSYRAQQTNPYELEYAFKHFGAWFFQTLSIASGQYHDHRQIFIQVKDNRQVQEIVSVNLSVQGAQELAYTLLKIVADLQKNEEEA